MKSLLTMKYVKWGYLLWGLGNFYLSYKYLPQIMQDLVLSLMFGFIGLYLCGKFAVEKIKEKEKERTAVAKSRVEVKDDAKSID